VYGADAFCYTRIYGGYIMINRIRYANETSGPLAALYGIDSDLRILEARPNIGLAGSQSYWAADIAERKDAQAEELRFHMDLFINHLSAFGYTEEDIARVVKGVAS
jgi:hypothetical protein